MTQFYFVVAGFFGFWVVCLFVFESKRQNSTKIVDVQKTLDIP